jgi:EpsI family protein
MLQASRDWRWFLTVGLIVASMAGLERASRGTTPARSEELSSFPITIDGWSGRDIPIEERVQEVLGASDLLNRFYIDPKVPEAISIFVAYYDSQRRGGAIHSPKNCLPGAGWSIMQAEAVPITLPGRAEPAKVNRVLIQKGMDKQVVLYWYQSQGRVVASEYTAKMCLLWDAATKNRTDGAIVRFTASVKDGDEEAAMERIQEFLNQAYPNLQELIPT